MPRPAKTDEQRRQTRRKIREAAAELYVENGLKDISARRVADKAGVSVGTLYSYFDNLTELMQSLWKQPLVRLHTEMEQVVSAAEHPLEKIRALLEAYAQFANEQRSVYRSAFLFVRPSGDDKPIPVSPDQDRIFSMLSNSVIAAQQQGLIRAGDPNGITQTLWSAIHGAIALPLNLDRLALKPPEDALPAMIDALLQWLSVKIQ